MSGGEKIGRGQFVRRIMREPSSANSGRSPIGKPEYEVFGLAGLRSRSSNPPSAACFSAARRTESGKDDEPTAPKATPVTTAGSVSHRAELASPGER